jgi:hypothetical protein
MSNLTDTDYLTTMTHMEKKARFDWFNLYFMENTIIGSHRQWHC